MIECVTIENNHFYAGNPICEQHKLRYQSIIKRQNWDVPYIKNMEYDSYDNPAAHYLVKRDGSGKAVGVARLYPTDRPYMLEEHFPFLISKCSIPKDEYIWETTRFCIDSSLPPEERKYILHQLVVAHLEFALERQIKKIVAVTYPVFWKNIFINSGWNVEWMGDVHKSDEGLKMIAGSLNVSQKILSNVRKVTEIQGKVLRYEDTHLEIKRYGRG
ncbi:MAG: acyl-homoserine-lactone synthase [Alphaproteobacteria bacterium]